MYDKTLLSGTCISLFLRGLIKYVTKYLVMSIEKPNYTYKWTLLKIKQSVMIFNEIKAEMEYLIRNQTSS